MVRMIQNTIYMKWFTEHPIEDEFWIIYDIDNIKGITKIYHIEDAHNERQWRVIQLDGTIRETACIKNFYSLKGDIAFEDVEYIKSMHKKYIGG